MRAMRGAFESKVRRQVHSLKEEPHRKLLFKIADKRRKWLGCRAQRDARRWTPREAFELLLIEYLGLTRDTVPIVSEKDDEIVWDSMNECPTLDACNRLGLDTKAVCREVYEKSTQAFLSELDPQLRFWRSYDHIRPHAPSCREAIYRIDFESMMRLAIEEAEISRSAGDEASGAVLVLGQEVIATGHDTVLEHDEPSAHAAMRAIRKGNKSLDDSNLCGGVLFTTCEPCAICTAQAIRANLTTIVYGAARRGSTNTGKRRSSSSCRAVVERAPIWLEVIGGVLEEECKSLFL